MCVCLFENLSFKTKWPSLICCVIYFSNLLCLSVLRRKPRVSNCTSSFSKVYLSLCLCFYRNAWIFNYVICFVYFAALLYFIDSFIILFKFNYRCMLRFLAIITQVSRVTSFEGYFLFCRCGCQQWLICIHKGVVSIDYVICLIYSAPVCACYAFIKKKWLFLW